MMNIQRMLTVAFLFMLAACGGGGGGSPAPTTQSVNGVVADGYLKGAKVCLDTNLNKTCDAGEPTDITGEGGAYAIASVSIADLAKYPVVVEVPVGAVDSERGTVGAGYVLTAPAGSPQFVSPLTTMVQSQIETNGLSVTEAIAAVKNQLGLVTISPMADYKPGTAGASVDQVIAAGLAKVIATSFADNKKSIETALGAGTSVTVQQVVNLAVQQVMQNLSALVLQVNAATNNGTSALSEDKVAEVISSSGLTVSTSNATTLHDELATAGTKNTGPNSLKLTLVLQGASAGSVKGVQTTITLPAGVMLRADASGIPLYGALSATGSALSGVAEGKYTPASATAPATLTVGLITSGSFAVGDIILVNADFPAGSSAPIASDFKIGSSQLVDASGNIVVGASLVLK